MNSQSHFADTSLIEPMKLPDVNNVSSGGIGMFCVPRRHNLFQVAPMGCEQYIPNAKRRRALIGLAPTLPAYSLNWLRLVKKSGFL